MKRFLICLCLVAFFLTGCGGEGETSFSGELSPGLDYLRKDAVLYRHTAYQEDLSFTSGEFCALTGAVAELIMEVLFSPFGYRIVTRWRAHHVGQEYLDYMNGDLEE